MLYNYTNSAKPSLDYTLAIGLLSNNSLQDTPSDVSSTADSASTTIVTATNAFIFAYTSKGV